MLEEQLSALGLSDKEAVVYQTVLASGKTTPARIAIATGINRGTVYAVCKQLLDAGYILEDGLKGVTYYTPTPPKELLKITKSERQTLIEKELKLGELAKSIATLPQSKTYAVPRLRFVEHEDKIVEYLYENTERWYGSLPHDERTWYGFQDHTLVEHKPYVDWIAWHWKESPQSQLYLLSNDSEAEKQIQTGLSPNRHIKFWKKSFKFTESEWIVGEYAILIMTKQKPHFLLEMHDAIYADNMRELFRSLWEEIA